MGTYTLLLECGTAQTVKFGAEGTYEVAEGIFTYTGSVPGEGFSRVRRHWEVCEGERDVEHWHIDSLLRADGTRICGVFTTTEDVECAVAKRLPVRRFGTLGASDCDCETHFGYGEQLDVVGSGVAEVYGSI